MVTEPNVSDGHEPSAIEVVPRAVADEIVAEATAAIHELERELEDVQRAATGDAEPLDEAAHFLIEQAEALVTDAKAHRVRVIDAARAEAATIIVARTNGQR